MRKADRGVGSTLSTTAASSLASLRRRCWREDRLILEALRSAMSLQIRTGGHTLSEQVQQVARDVALGRGTLPCVLLLPSELLPSLLVHGILVQRMCRLHVC